MYIVHHNWTGKWEKKQAFPAHIKDPLCGSLAQLSHCYREATGLRPGRAVIFGGECSSTSRASGHIINVSLVPAWLIWAYQGDFNYLAGGQCQRLTVAQRLSFLSGPEFKSWMATFFPHLWQTYPSPIQALTVVQKSCMFLPPKFKLFGLAISITIIFKITLCR